MMGFLMRLWLTAGLVFGLVSSASAITLYSSSQFQLFTVPAERGANNSQPVDFVDPASLAQLLASLQLNSAAAGESIYLMSDDRAVNAGKQLATALSRVGRNQDIHLAAYRDVGKFWSVRRFGTGARVFVEDGNINLIFGQVDQFITEFRIPEPNVAQAGSRASPHMRGGTIKPAAWFKFKPGRRDWILFPVNTAKSPRQTLKLDSGAEGAEHAQRAKPAEQAQRTAPGSAGPRPSGSSASRWQDLEEGLETLDRLKQKGLVTEAEYQAKRKALLDGVGL